MPNTDRPTWIRWHRLTPRLAADLASGHVRLYLALHAHNDTLAILAVPAAERISLSHLEVSHVPMTIVRTPPSGPPRAQSHKKNKGQRQR